MKRSHRTRIPRFYRYGVVLALVAAGHLDPTDALSQVKAPAISSIGAGVITRLGGGGRTGLFLDGQYLRPIASHTALGVGLTLSTQSRVSREMTIAPEVSIVIPTLAHKATWFTAAGAGYGVPVTGDGLRGGPQPRPIP